MEIQRSGVKYKNLRKPVVCYYASWSTYRVSSGSHPVSMINPLLCTHLIYAFAGLDEGEFVIKSLDPWNDLPENGGKGSYRAFNNLRSKNPCLKTLLAIGGWNEGSEKYSQMASSKRARETFADSVVEFLNKHKFDGLDLDWEYPTLRGGIPEDRENFVKLLEVLKERLEEDGKLLSVAVGAAQDEDVYAFKEICNVVDFVNIMTYDYVTAAESKVTGLQAPLPDIKLSVKRWINNGCPKNKIMLGVPFYAQTFQLSNLEENGLDVPVKGPGQAGRFTKQAGMLSYYEILEKFEEGDYEIVKGGPSIANNYATSGSQWYTYDDEESIEYKVNYVIDEDLGGVMVYAIDTDDFRGSFSDVRRPLLQKINDLLTD